MTGDIRHAALSDPLDADVYVPRRQVVRDNTWLLLQSSRPAAAVLAELRERVKSINPDVALTDAATMEARLAESAAPERFRAIVTGTLAALTLLLAVVGLHGVVSYAVAQRTREIGVRLALGQRPGAVVGVVMGDTLRTVAGGAVPGVLAAFYAGRWLSSVVMVNADQTAVLTGWSSFSWPRRSLPLQVRLGGRATWISRRAADLVGGLARAHVARRA